MRGSNLSLPFLQALEVLFRSWEKWKETISTRNLQDTGLYFNDAVADMDKKAAALARQMNEGMLEALADISYGIQAMNDKFEKERIIGAENWARMMESLELYTKYMETSQRDEIFPNQNLMPHTKESELSLVEKPKETLEITKKRVLPTQLSKDVNENRTLDPAVRKVMQSGRHVSTLSSPVKDLPYERSGSTSRRAGQEEGKQVSSSTNSSDSDSLKNIFGPFGGSRGKHREILTTGGIESTAVRNGGSGGGSGGGDGGGGDSDSNDNNNPDDSNAFQIDLYKVLIWIAAFTCFFTVLYLKRERKLRRCMAQAA